MAEDLASKAGQVTIGGLRVNRMGLGTNRITESEDSYALLRAAVDAGVNFIDTAHRYGAGASEKGIAAALAPYKEGLLITTKCGYDYSGEAGSPEELRRHLEESLKRLQMECIDLYQLHRVDPKVPIEESVGALKRFQEEGKIKSIGLSEVSLEQLKAAGRVAKIDSVQNEYNIIVRKHDELLNYCTVNGIVFMPWFPLGGLSGGAEKVEAMLKNIAEKYGAAPQQIALAWLLKRSPLMLPIPGTLSIEHLYSNLRASDVSLSEDDYDLLTDMSS
jgi:pyridoxine 4-dehydrogenase